MARLLPHADLLRRFGLRLGKLSMPLIVFGLLIYATRSASWMQSEPKNNVQPENPNPFFGAGQEQISVPVDDTGIALSVGRIAIEEEELPVQTAHSIETDAVLDGDAEPVDQSAVSNSLKQLIERLRQSLQTIAAIPAYSATLEQQVEKNGRLLEPDWIDFKLRRSPFSVYMKWRDDGQEALYVAGKHDGKVLVHPTRGLVSLRRIWKLTPDSRQALKNSRYPITEVGIENLTRKALDFYETSTATESNSVCVESRALANGRPAILYDVSFSDDQISPEYSASRLTFDETTGLLVSVENWGWGTDGRPGSLLEQYRYHGFEQAPQMGDEHFEVENPNYEFIRH